MPDGSIRFRALAHGGGLFSPRRNRATARQRTESIRCNGHHHGRQPGSSDPPAIHLKESDMNWDRIEGNWKQFKGKAKEQWGKLTDDQLDVIAGKRDNLAGKLQEAYGISKDDAEKQLDEWEKRM